MVVDGLTPEAAEAAEENAPLPTETAPDPKRAQVPPPEDSEMPGVGGGGLPTLGGPLFRNDNL